MECNVQPYGGSDPFVFAEFHQSDAMRVYPIIERLGLSGVRMWYELEKIPQQKAERLERSSVFLFFVSSVFMERFEASSILSYVVSQSIPILTVYLDENIQMTAGTRMQLDLKFVTSFNAWDANLLDSVLSAKAIQNCVVPNIKCSSQQRESEGTKNQSVSSKDSPVVQEKIPVAIPEKPPVVKKIPSEVPENPPAKPVVEPEKPPKVQPSLDDSADPTDADDPYGEMTVYIPRTPPTTSRETKLVEGDDDERTVLQPKLQKAIVWRQDTGAMYVVSKAETILGRKSEKRKADIMIDGNPGISRNHAVIYQYKNSFLIRDCGSLAGTFIAGEQIEKDKAVELKNETCFCMGDEKFVFLSGGTAKMLIENGRAVVLTSEDTGEKRILTEESTVLGRTRPWKNGLLEDLTISRRHAIIAQQNGKSYIQDPGSVNGTYVNGEELTPNAEPRLLCSGDRIHLHTFAFQYTECEVK